MVTDSNFARYVETQRMHVLIGDLIRVGITLGVEVAERMYLSLREEPRDAQGERVDWLAIRAAIEQGKA